MSSVVVTERGGKGSSWVDTTVFSSGGRALGGFVWAPAHDGRN